MREQNGLPCSYCGPFQDICSFLSCCVNYTMGINNEHQVLIKFYIISIFFKCSAVFKKIHEDYIALICSSCRLLEKIMLNVLNQALGFFIAHVFFFFLQVTIIIIGNALTSLTSPVQLESPISKASHWSVHEKIRHFEVNALDRTTLFEPFVYLASRLHQPVNKGGFPSMVRKSVRLDSS